MIVFKRFITSRYLFAAVAINLKSISTSSNSINLNSHVKEVRVCNEKNCDIWDYQPRVLIQGEMEVNGMWSIVNIEKTLSPSPPLPPFHAPFPATFPAPFPTPFQASFPAPFYAPFPTTFPAAFPAPFPAPFHAPFSAPFYATFPAPLPAPLPVLSSVHCRQKKTKLYHLITLDNYWISSTPLISYRCPRLSQVVR